MAHLPLTRRAALGLAPAGVAAASLALNGCSQAAGSLAGPGMAGPDKAGPDKGGPDNWGPGMAGAGMRIAGRNGPIEARVFGRRDDPCIVMIPSLGRGAQDFTALAQAVAGARFHVVCPEPRGFAGSAPFGEEAALGHLAEDVADVIMATGARPAVVLGHAFGNRVARMCAAARPDLVRALILLAAGGKVGMARDIEQALLASFDLSLPDAERMQAVATAFFAPGNDAGLWRDGWRRDVAQAQIAASERTPVDAWWQAGGARILVIQPMQDVLAPAENAERLRASAPDRVQVVYVDRAGHALLPEQPEAVAGAVIGFLKSLPA